MMKLWRKHMQFACTCAGSFLPSWAQWRA